jgi:hypothetical protein
MPIVEVIFSIAVCSPNAADQEQDRRQTCLPEGLSDSGNSLVMVREVHIQSDVKISTLRLPQGYVGIVIQQ